MYWLINFRIKNFITLHRTKFSTTKKFTIYSNYSFFMMSMSKLLYITSNTIDIYTRTSKHIMSCFLSFGYSTIECTHRWLTFNAILQLGLHLKVHFSWLVCVLVYPWTRKQVTHTCLYTISCSKDSLEVFTWWNNCPWSRSLEWANTHPYTVIWLLQHWM